MAEEVMAAFMMYIMKKPMVKFIIRSKCVNMTFYMLYTSSMSLRESPHNTNLYNLLFHEFAFCLCHSLDLLKWLSGPTWLLWQPRDW